MARASVSFVCLGLEKEQQQQAGPAGRQAVPKSKKAVLFCCIQQELSPIKSPASCCCRCAGMIDHHTLVDNLYNWWHKEKLTCAY